MAHVKTRARIWIQTPFSYPTIHIQLQVKRLAPLVQRSTSVTGPAALPFIPFLRGPIHTFKQPPWVFLIQRQQLPGSLADLGQCEFDPPDLTFVPKPILAYKMKGGADRRTGSIPRTSAKDGLLASGYRKSLETTNNP